MKRTLAALLCAALLAAAAGCEKPMAAADENFTQEAATDSVQADFSARGSRIAEEFFKTGETACPRLRSYGPYASYYLEDGTPLLSFWSSVQEGTDCEIELLFPREDGAVFFERLSLEDGKPYARFLRLTQNPDGTVDASDYAGHPVQDWCMTEEGNFYYRLFSAGDKHYADYQLIRTAPPDAQYLSALERYVLPIDYYYVNLLITDWSEPDFAGVSFNDLFDRLYAQQYGRQPEKDAYRRDAASGAYLIPAEEFEETLLPFFSLSQDRLRALAGYIEKEDAYPWRPIETNDMERYYYPAVEPYLTDIRENPDGTKTLFLSCLSADVPTDCIFSHELTVRDLPAGGFQYVSNAITVQTAYGLPNSTPRLDAK